MAGSLVGNEPGGFGAAAEGSVDHASFRTVEEESVVDDPNAALNIVQFVSREGAPGGGSKGKVQGGPMIDGNRTVSQRCDHVLERVTQSFLRVRIDYDARAQSPREGVVAECHRE